MLTDLLQSLRSLRRSPFLCTMALLTLALGIGVNTTMFSIIDATLLRGMPMREEGRVLRLSLHEGDSISQASLQMLRERQQSFVSLVAYQDRALALSGPGGDPESISGTVIDSGGPTTLEAPLSFGRWYTAAEDLPGAAPVVVISHVLWKNRYQADPGILGKQIRIDDEWAAVIGVAAPGFRFPHSQLAWMPPRGIFLQGGPEDRPHQVFGRLKPGVSVEQARAEMLGLVQRLQKDQPEAKVVWKVRLRSLSSSYNDEPGILWIMLGAVFFVLLIACVNVANLLLARAVVRGRELAVRSALGAARGQLVRLLLMESAVLAAAGSLLGLGVAWLCMAAFQQAVVGAAPPYWMNFALDARALLYTVGLAGLSCLAAGLLPAWRLSRPDLNATLNDGSRGATSGRVGRITRVMVVGEIAFSCALLVASALMIRSVQKMHSLPLGFEPAGVFTARMGPPKRDYPEVADRKMLYQRLLADLQSRPEVAAVGVSSSLPIWYDPDPIAIEGAPAPRPGEKGPAAVVREVSPGYLPAMRVPLLEGRALADSDTAEAPAVALATRALAERHWPTKSALGQRVRVGEGPTERWVTIVGVVANTMQGRFDTETLPQLYVPFLQTAEVRRMSFFVRAQGIDAAALAPLLRSALRGQNADVPLNFAMPLSTMIAEAMFYRKLTAGLFSVFGAAAFVLAVIGLYGVMSYGVAQRRQEMGVRLALGATARDLVHLVVRQGSLQLLIGLGLGLAIAAGVAQLLASSLYGIDPLDPVSFVATTLALGAAGLLASFIPGLRAGRVDPATVLRGG